MIVKVQLFIELLNEQLLNFCICLDNKKNNVEAIKKRTNEQTGFLKKS